MTGVDANKDGSNQEIEDEEAQEEEISSGDYMEDIEEDEEEYRQFTVDSDLEEFKGNDALYINPDELLNNIKQMRMAVDKITKVVTVYSD